MTYPNTERDEPKYTTQETITHGFLAGLEMQGISNDLIVVSHIPEHVGQLYSRLARESSLQRMRLGARIAQDPQSLPVRAQSAIIADAEIPWSVDDLSTPLALALGIKVAKDLAERIYIYPQEVAMLVLTDDLLEVEIARLSPDLSVVHVTAGIWAWAWRDEDVDTAPF